MSSLVTTAQGATSGGGSGTLLLFALPLLLLAYLFWSQRSRQRRVASMQAELQVGDEVMTSTGLYGRIVDLDEQVVILEAAPGVQLRWDRRAIVRPQQPTGGQQGQDPQQDAE